MQIKSLLHKCGDNEITILWVIYQISSKLYLCLTLGYWGGNSKWLLYTISICNGKPLFHWITNQNNSILIDTSDSVIVAMAYIFNDPWLMSETDWVLTDHFYLCLMLGHLTHKLQWLKEGVPEFTVTPIFVFNISC